jgi:hypothetical protein
LYIIGRRPSQDTVKVPAKKHLQEMQARAEVAKNKEKVTDITALMLREDGQSMWKQINKVTRAPRTGTLMRVEREINGEIFEFTERSKTW